MADDTVTPPPAIPPTARRRRKTDSWQVRAKHWAGIGSAFLGGLWAAYQAALAIGVKGWLVIVPVAIAGLSNFDIARGKQ